MAIKKIISPLQTWLLQRGNCVGCGASLSKGKRSSKGDEEKVTCKCGRVFVFEKKNKKYRRALSSEA